MPIQHNSLLDRLAYGFPSNPHQLMRLYACVANWICAVYFISTCQIHQLPLSLLIVAIFTLAAYEAEPRACGCSTVWAFYYGFQLYHSSLDNFLYALYSGVLLVPWFALSPGIERYTGFCPWPWHHHYALIAIVAHILFAILGHATRRLVM